MRSELMPVMMTLAKEKKYIPTEPVKDMEKVQPANTKGGMSARSKIATGIGLIGAAAYGGYRLGKHLTTKTAKNFRTTTTNCFCTKAQQKGKRDPQEPVPEKDLLQLEIGDAYDPHIL